MIFLRNILKNWLKFLSQWAIRKHHMKLVVISGWYGPELTRELVYNILRTKFTVRRVTSSPWWDLSIPLAILGYADKRRSLFAWFALLFRAIFSLTFGRSNPSTLILNLNYSEPETTKYWAGFVRPDLLLITNLKEKLNIVKKVVRNTVARDGTLIFNYKDKEVMQQLLGSYEHTFTFGADKNADLYYHLLPNTGLGFVFKGQEYHLQKELLPGVKVEIIASALAVAADQSVPLLDAMFEIAKYPLPAKMLDKLKLDLLT